VHSKNAAAAKSSHDRRSKRGSARMSEPFSTLLSNASRFSDPERHVRLAISRYPFDDVRGFLLVGG
jgi:hypothetical protein